MPKPARRPAPRRRTPPRARPGRLTHLNRRGEARMVNVADKPATLRRAVAEGEIRMQPATLALILRGGHKKGDVLAVARVAAIQAAKKTAELIPLCHPLALSAVEVEFAPQRARNAVRCRAAVTTTGPTGVEMEALTAVSAGLLTVYDMCKAVDRGMTLGRIRLLAKSGGRSGDWRRPARAKLI